MNLISKRDPIVDPTRALAPSHVYRPDIDGLRAIAVLPVVLGHIKAPGFWGGYVGVDIFFVISGFLITSILVQDMHGGRYSIAEFYRRRILRIFPALFVMLAVTTVAAAFWMLPGELLRYAKSLAASAFFSTNILFYFESGYFEPASHLKPLLHTWSLAIEEQFYILWPLALAAIGASKRKLRLAFALGIVAASFGASVWMVAVDRSAAFYLLPARAWELGLGALIALVPALRAGKRLNQALALLGVALIGYAVKFYNEGTPFPGAAAALPALGAALIIFTGAQGSLVGRALSAPPLVFIGKISYSLYLWHWPVIVFSEIGLFLPHTPTVMAGQFLVSLLAAILSWRFVETPFRDMRWARPRFAISTGLFAMGMSAAVAAFLVGLGGLTGRFTPAQQKIAAYEDLDGDKLYRAGTCFAAGRGEKYDAAHCWPSTPQQPSLLLLGDSHAAHFWPGFDGANFGYEVIQATHTGCRPLLYGATSKGECQNFFRDILARSGAQAHPSATLLAGRWTEADLPLLAQTLADPRVRSLNPIVIGPIPTYESALPRLLVFSEVREDPSLVRRSLTPEIFVLDRKMARLAQATRTPYISLTSALCHGGACATWAAAKDEPLQFDYGHLTASGSKDVVSLIMPQVDRAANASEAKPRMDAQSLN